MDSSLARGLVIGCMGEWSGGQGGIRTCDLVAIALYLAELLVLTAVQPSPRCCADRSLHDSK